MPSNYILVADDSRTLRTYVRRTLAEVGHHVEVACDGFEAVRMIEAECPNVAILDINMPGKDGFGVLEELKGMGAPYCDLPVILLTRNKSQALETLGKQVGAFLHKPASRRVLIETVKRFLHDRDPIPDDSCPMT